MRCITAIWPAGPPKLNIATRSHTRSASRSETPCCGFDSRASAIESSATSYFLCVCAHRWPVLLFGLKAAAPRIEGVVDHHAVLEHFVVVGEIGREAARDRGQALALRREVGPRCIGTSDDRRQMVESRIVNVVDAYDRIEGTMIAYMPELNTLDVVWSRTRLRGDREDF